MTRGQSILAAVLVLQLLLIFLIRGPFAGGKSGQGGELLPELESFTASRIAITDGEGSSVTLARSGEAWSLEDLDGYPATSDRVDKLLTDLGSITARRPVVSSGRYHASLKVAKDDFERRVRVWGDDGLKDPEVDLYVGTSPNVGVSHVRRADQDRVYEASGITPFEMMARPDSWVDRRLIDMPVEEVIGFALQNTHGRFSLEKDGERWRVREPATRASARVDDEKLTALLRTFTNLWVAEPVGRRNEASQGLGSPAATITLQRRAPGDTTATTTTLQIGDRKPDGQGERFSALAGSEFAATLSKVPADKATDQKLSDLLSR